jgi:hypothetical protein
MGTIGNFEYPEYKITDSIQVAQIVEEQFKGKVENQAALAAALGHKTLKSGGYIGKITALRRYGLVSGRGELITTQLAKQILHPMSEEEKTEAIAEAMENVELFKKIFERLGETIPTDSFWVDLVEITGEDRSVAQKDAIKLRNLYMDGYRFLASARKAEIKPKAIEAKAEPAKAEMPTTPTDALFELRTKDYGTLIVKDEESIEVARNLINIIERKIKTKKNRVRQTE